MESLVFQFSGYKDAVGGVTYDRESLYNGNIAAMATSIRHFGELQSTQSMNYRYDQLHRIAAAHASKWEGIWTTVEGSYNTSYAYDGNGNIQNLYRNNLEATTIDELYYHYDPVKKNRLDVVKDGGTAEGLNNANPYEYKYDQIGNLTQNLEDGIADIEWNIYGKVEKVTKTPDPFGIQATVEYRYDGTGNRIMKKVSAGATSTITTYLRDASGNVMAIYEEKTDQTLAIKEIPIYGSSRLGQYRPKTDAKKTALGQRIYEFSNHLGNVLVTLTDNKVPQTDGTYESVVVSASDYYPFGMAMAERTYSNSEYRYEFNGKENDTDFGNDQLIQDYGFRLYAPSVVRFFSVDPLSPSYPWYTPYQFAGNKPITFIDLDGLEEADPQQLKKAEGYYRKIKLEQSTHFKYITPKLINDQVKYRFRNLGKPIDQGTFFLCGPAAACHILASHDPYMYVKIIFDLYTSGLANNGQIEGNEAIYNAKPDAKGKIDGMPAVDWILLHSLRRSENMISWGGYNPHIKDDTDKMTLVGEFEDLVERLGANVSFKASDMDINNPDDFNTLSQWISEEKRAVLFINSRAYKNTDSGDGIDGWISENYGRHFIVLKGISENQKTCGITVEYWDYGNTGKLRSKTFSSFDEFKKATFDYWLIENNSKPEKNYSVPAKEQIGPLKSDGTF